MLRSLYRCVLSAHPAYFRRRFADEMLSIFDQADGKLSAAKLLVDGVTSLLRQWALRPEFWEAPPAHAAAGDAPLFCSLENPKPRTAALVYGVLLSGLALNGASIRSWIQCLRRSGPCHPRSRTVMRRGFRMLPVQ